MVACTTNEEQASSERDLEKLTVKKDVCRKWVSSKLVGIYFLLATFALLTVHAFQSGCMGATKQLPQMGNWQLFADSSAGLTKRSRWSMMVEKEFAPLFAAAGLSTAVEPRVCPDDGRRCAGEMMSRLLSQSLGLSLDNPGGQWKFQQPHPPYEKRDVAEYAFETVTELSTEIKDKASSLAAFNISLVGRIRNKALDGLVKRDEEAPEDSYMMESPFGYHLVSPLSVSADAMFNDIIEQTKAQTAGTIEATLRGASAENSLQKRGPIMFSVEWVSYQWSRTQYIGLKLPYLGQALVEDFEKVNNYLRYARAWKYCASVHRYQDPNRGVTYESFNADTGILYGEMYFNTYGNIERFCVDDKGGAQCSGEACDGSNN
ncbi:AaceriAGL359Cp [[Ashbya] aceris (nom. inval.)]|nr:AaceriAGL359Cp [[Ashbya] aceris (nom. inval.)]